LINYNQSPENSSLVKFLASPFFDLGHFSSEATVNLENRVEVYSNPNYEETFATVSEYGQ